MEYIPRSLEEYMCEMGEAIFGQICAQIIVALMIFHSTVCEVEDKSTKEVTRLSFVHRDVKPDNLRVRANGSLVLIDFGISGELFKND